jgi:peptidoglycan/LPS O-acetylase OafA/YrhL
MSSVSSANPMRRRYVTLDGLRGVAAIMVVLFHSGNGTSSFYPRFGYLAVDLFFILSGFVLTYRYEKQFEHGMKPTAFLAIRAIRLYPLYLFGLMLGAATVFLNSDIAPPSFTSVATSIGLNLFGFPSLVEFAIAPAAALRNQYVFSLNPPLWSIFFEFWVANAVFASLIGKLTNWKRLAALILVSAVGLIVCERLFYTLSIGWLWKDFIGGFPRVMFSFFSGLALARLHFFRPPTLRLPSWLFVAALPILLSLPFEGKLARLYELFCVLIVFPAFIYWGAEAIEYKPKLGAVLGDVSYAVYAIHFPLWLLFSWSILRFGIHLDLVIQLLFVSIVLSVASVLRVADAKLRAKVLRTWQRDRARIQSGDLVAKNV